MKRPARILLMVENVPLARDHRLRKQVGSLVASGFEVSVICRADPANRRQRGIRLYEYRPPAEGRGKLGFVWEYTYSWTMAALLTAKAFLTGGFDAIQISGTPDIYFTIGAPFKLLGKPLVLDQRDLSPELYEVHFGRRDLVYSALRQLERASFRAADHVITVNRSLEEAVYQRGGLLPGSVTVVGNGPQLEKTSKKAPDPRLRQGKKFLCCWLGLMGPQDRLDVALRVVQYVVHVIGRTDCQFVFLGDGEAREPSLRLARELDVSDWVSFPGWCDEEEAFTFLSTADLGLEPNLEEIVSPVKGMEYMAFGLPFVAFDLRETRELAGEAAAYAAPGDEAAMGGLVDELLNNPERRAEMGRVGRRRIEERFAWDRQQEGYVQVYERLVGHGAGHRRRGGEGQSCGVATAVAPAPTIARPKVTSYRRARHRLRTCASEFPRLYLPFARWKYPGPSPEVIGPETELVIEGYTRSAMTFAVYALQLSQKRPVRLAHHLHAPAQVVEAVRRGIPTLVLIREPEGAILSQLIREPNVAMRDALFAYIRYYARIERYRHGFVGADFEEVTHDFGSVVARLNTRFGTSLIEFVHTEEAVRECMELIKLRGTHSRTLLGFESGLVSLEALRADQENLERQPKREGPEAWVPSARREGAKRALQEQWASPHVASLRQRAQCTYLAFLRQHGLSVSGAAGASDSPPLSASGR
jgi:glycosyltransferase involved in cell wall biosynthesis